MGYKSKTKVWCHICKKEYKDDLSCKHPVFNEYGLPNKIMIIKKAFKVI